jgi:hypothetical protein
VFPLDEGIRTTVGTGIAAGGPSNGSQTTLVVAIVGLALGLIVLAAVIRFPWTTAIVSGRARTTKPAPESRPDVQAKSAPLTAPAHMELEATAVSGHPAKPAPPAVPGLLATAAIVGAIAWFWRRQS